MRILFLAIAGLSTFGQALTLEEAKAAALRNHPGIQVAEFGAEAASERILQAESALRPVLSANITGAGAADASRVAAGALNNPIIYSRLALGATVTQTVTDFGRTRELVASSKITSQAERERVKATKADILLQVERAYFQALRSHAVTEIAKSTVESRQLLVDQVEALVNAKLKSGLDLSIVSTNLAEGKLLLASAQNEEQAALAMLAEAMGASDPITQTLTEVDMREPLEADRSKLTSDALRMRPELIAGRLDSDAAQRLANAEHALRYPTISAVATAGVIPARVDNLSSRYVAGGVNVSLPFLNGGLFKSRQREAELRANQAEKRVRQMENVVSRDVAVALLDVTTAADRLNLTKQLIAQAVQAVELAQSRYDLGLSSIVELSQAQLAKTNAEIQSATARYDYQLRRAVLDFRTGAMQ